MRAFLLGAEVIWPRYAASWYYNKPQAQRLEPLEEEQRACLFIISTSSLEKYIFRSSAHFLIRLLFSVTWRVLKGEVRKCWGWTEINQRYSFHQHIKGVLLSLPQKTPMWVDSVKTWPTEGVFRDFISSSVLSSGGMEVVRKRVFHENQ